MLDLQYWHRSVVAKVVITARNAEYVYAAGMNRTQGAETEHVQCP